MGLLKGNSKRGRGDGDERLRESKVAADNCAVWDFRGYGVVN